MKITQVISGTPPIPPQPRQTYNHTHRDRHTHTHTHTHTETHTETHTPAHTHTQRGLAGRWNEDGGWHSEILCRTSPSSLSHARVFIRASRAFISCTRTHHMCRNNLTCNNTKTRVHGDCHALTVHLPRAPTRTHGHAHVHVHARGSTHTHTHTHTNTKE